jgi:uncharacterized protein
MVISDEIYKRIDDFILLCQEHSVKNLYAFGSSINDKFDYSKSDIDLLVEIDENDPIVKGEKLLDLWDKFENYFHRKVDLLTESSLKNPYLKNSIDSTKVRIYDGSRQKVLV